MKNIKKLFIFVVLLGLTFNLVGCNKNSSGSELGKYTIYEAEKDGVSIKLSEKNLEKTPDAMNFYIELLKDNKVHISTPETMKKFEKNGSEGTYKIEGNKITIFYNDLNLKGEIEKDTIKLKNEASGTSITFKKSN